MCVHDGRGWGVKGKADLVGLVRERERKRERQRQRQRDRETERKSRANITG